MKTLGNNIDTLRKSAGMTVQELADKVGISRIYLSAIKSGRRDINGRIIQRIADALNCEPEDIISRPSGPDKEGKSAPSLALSNNAPAKIDNNLFELAKSTVYEMIEAGEIPTPKGEVLVDVIYDAYNYAVEVEREKGKVSSLSIAAQIIREQNSG